MSNFELRIMNFELRHILIGLLTVLLSACEVIPEGDRITEVFTPTDPTAIKRTSLLIEYSGWQCVNCPTAAEVAHDLKAQYGENLVVVVMHPESNPNTRHNNKPELNYTCPLADIIYKQMGGTNTTPFPTGNVNMLMSENNYFCSMDKWATLVSDAYTHAKPFVISQTVVPNADTTEVSITVEISNLDTIAHEVTRMIWLTEDKVIGKQKKPEGTDNAYEHNHLLRDGITASNGETLTIDAMQTARNTYHYTLPEKVVAANCHIVALVSVNGEVVQANETKVIKE